MKKINLIIISSIALMLCSCYRISYKGLNDNIKNLPPSDFSYVIQPKFTESKASAENQLKNLFSAEDSNIGIYSSHRFDKETKKQIVDRMWLHITLSNPEILTDFDNDETVTKLAKEVAKNALKKIDNASDYEIVKITFIENFHDEKREKEKTDVLLTIPELYRRNF